MFRYQCVVRPARKHWILGFTLIEMLVVLLVMGLLVGLVSVTVRPDDRGLLQVEAERLAQLLRLASEEAAMTGKALRWTSDGSTYRFFRLHEDGSWGEVRDGNLLRARGLPQGMAVSGLRVESQRPQGVMRLEFVPYGPPLVFSAEISLGEERFAVVSSPVGEVKVLPGRGEANAKLAPR